MELKKINNQSVKPIPLEKNTLPVKGGEVFDELYSNIFILGRKKMGKTCCIYKILKSCVNKNTNLIFYVSTINKDASWIKICEYFENRGNPIQTYTSIDEKPLLEALDECYFEPSESEESDDETYVDVAFDCHDTDDPQEVKKKKYKYKPKYVAQDVIFVFDDQGMALRSKEISDFLKKNRHFKAKIIISSQYLNDLQPQALKQLDYILIFPGQSEDKLKLVYKHLDFSVSYEKFASMYKMATQKKYNFLYCNSQKEEFRKNFNYLFV